MDSSKLLLSGLRALWGIITPNIRKISIHQNENNLLLCFYYDEEPTEIEIELSEEAASEMIADFPEPFLINCERSVVKAPKEINRKGHLLYSRFEPQGYSFAI
jgi:hypothetical protein